MCLEIPPRRGMCFQADKGNSEKNEWRTVSQITNKGRVKKRKRKILNKEKNCL